MSLSTFSSGDPDLYINYGDSRLPTKEDSDISRATFKSEVVELSLDRDFYKSKKIKSMKGPYIIGVYGNKKSTYTLSITAEVNPMAIIVEGFSLKKVQEDYQTAYY